MKPDGGVATLTSGEKDGPEEQETRGSIGISLTSAWSFHSVFLSTYYTQGLVLGTKAQGHRGMTESLSL